jgi:hypothetical protein
MFVVADGVLRRTIADWWQAGIREDGRVIHRDLGTPLGGMMSTLLANSYRHARLDGRVEPDRHQADLLTSLTRVTTLENISMSVWLMLLTAEATTAKEPIDEKAKCQPLPGLRAPSSASAPSPFPVPGAAQLLTLPSSLKPLHLHLPEESRRADCGRDDQRGGHRLRL